MSCTYFTLNMLILSVSIKRKPQPIYFLTGELKKKCLCWGWGWGLENPKARKIPLTLKDQILFKSQSNHLLEILPKSMVGVLWQYGSIFSVLASEFQEIAFLYKYISGNGCIFLKQFLKLCLSE